MRISWTNLLQIKQTGIDKGIIICEGVSHQHSWKMLRLTNQYDAWSLWDPRKGSVASKSIKLQQNENDSKRTSNELLKISKDSNESLRAG